MKTLSGWFPVCLMILFSVPDAGAQGTGRRDRVLQVRTLPFDSLTLSDPFILADQATRTYYMTGSGGLMWKSKDLQRWVGPFQVVEIDTASWMGSRPMIWAAELHHYQGKYYYFATFTNQKIIVDTVPLRYHVQRRASHVLVSDRPGGPYKPIKKGVYYTPPEHSTLDGTLWVENGIPYMVYCHEWMQIIDGTMVAVPLAPDLSRPAGKPVTLFRAHQGPWVREMLSIGEVTFGMKLNGWVTDGPFLFRTQTGRLGMLWSSWGSKRYAQGVAYSESGRLEGPWVHEPEPLNSNNAGHGMLFRTFDGKLLMCLHHASPDPPGLRKPLLLEVDISGNRLKIIGPYKP